MNYDVAVIGGGASGLACAVRLAESGKKLNIAIIEACDRLGKKLAATGNGQGNISNADMTPSHYYGSGAFLAQKIACADPYAGSRLFDCLFSADEKGRIYPSGRQASALTDCFIRKLNNKADIYLSTKVINIEKGLYLSLSDGRKLNAKYVIFCAGGKAQKQFKTDGTAYNLITKFGHKVTPLYPSLVQLKTDTKYIKSLKGIRADCAVSAVVNGKIVKTVRGDVIFTEYGISGNAVFSVSPLITDKPDAAVSIEFLPDVAPALISQNIEQRRKAGFDERELLSGTLHNTLGRAVIARAKAENADIVKTLKNFTLPVTGTLGFDYAQVTRGGIDFDGVTEELESRFVKNLFFAGEVLDVDGDCGGYNLQWAFTSGVAAAEAVLKRI